MVHFTNALTNESSCIGKKCWHGILAFSKVAEHVVFAYPFHFGKSGFSATFFTPNSDIRILSGFLCAGLLLKIKMQ